MARRFASFRDFYPYYLGEHRDPRCRRLHFTGTSLVIVTVLAAVLTRNVMWLVAVPLAGYGFAWLGHALFERNRPATFRHPFYSLLGDFAMFRDMLIGRIRW
jgi:hypothetical protein